MNVVGFVIAVFLDVKKGEYDSGFTLVIDNLFDISFVDVIDVSAKNELDLVAEYYVVVVNGVVCAFYCFSTAVGVDRSENGIKCILGYGYVKIDFVAESGALFDNVAIVVNGVSREACGIIRGKVYVVVEASVFVWVGNTLGNVAVKNRAEDDKGASRVTKQRKAENER